MPAQPTTRWQVSGYRFLIRRMEHALVRRDVRMLADPMRSQSRALAVGVVLAVLGLAACGVLAVLRPQNKIGDHVVLVAEGSGAMFVVLGDTVHPVLNLASARLVAGEAAEPAIVADDQLAAGPRGALVGIPGAPSALPYATDGRGRTWTVCDRADGTGVTTSVLAGDPVLGADAGRLGPGEALLLRGRNAVTYLVYDGKRAVVDLGDGAVARAFALVGVPARAAGEALLDAIPEVPEIAPPRIDGSGGRPAVAALADRVIGSVVQLKQGQATQYYVVLRDGVQQVGAATADLIRAADSKGSPDMETIAPDVLSRVPTVQTLPVSTFPRTTPSIVAPADRPVACLSWHPVGEPGGRDGSGAELSVLTGRSLPLAADARPVPPARADGPGPNVDAAYLAPGSGAFVQTTGILADSSRRDSLFYVADTGVRYGVADAESARALGFDAAPEPAPWSIVSLLAPGPVLSRSAALVSHDGVAPDPAGGALPDRASPR